MYSSLSSSAEINEIMDRKEIHALVKSIILEDVSPIFIDMLRESEKRIDSTNSMVQQLAESITKNQDIVHLPFEVNGEISGEYFRTY